MDLIVRVSSDNPRAPLANVVRMALGLDIWEVKPDHIILSASEAQVERLSSMGYTIQQIQSTDAYLTAATEASSVAAERTTITYHSAETLEIDLRALADGAPDIAQLLQIGQSVEGRPIWALRIGDRRGSDRKLLFMGCHHAREWIAVEVPYLLAEHLIKHADTSPIKDWLSAGELWVAPMVNPDGHEHTRVADRLWRKNRRRNHDGSIGVDPNRNYGYMWGTLNIGTSSHTPSDPTYVGPRAFSEPETRAIRDLIARELFRGVITYHSYSQLILYPWGYTDDPIVDVPDRTRMQTLANQMAGLIRGVEGKVYVPQQASQLYPTAGDTTDWTYGVYGIPSFTIELRPDRFSASGFILPPDQIAPTWEENKPAAFAFIEQSL